MLDNEIEITEEESDTDSDLVSEFTEDSIQNEIDEQILYEE